MNLVWQILSVIWQGFWGTLSGIWPTLDSLFDINHKIVIAVIVALLGGLGVPAFIRNLVKHF